MNIVVTTSLAMQAMTLWRVVWPMTISRVAQAMTALRVVKVMITSTPV